MNSDEYYKHYLEETMGTKKIESILSEKKKEKSSSLLKWIFLLFFLGLLVGPYYLWQNKNHTDDISAKGTVAEKPQNTHVLTEAQKQAQAQAQAQKQEAEKERLAKLAQEKKQKILEAKRLEAERIAKKKRLQAEKEAKAKQEARLAQIAAEKKLKVLQEKAKAKAEAEARARIAQMEAKQKEEAKRKELKKDSLDKKVEDAQAGINNLEQALIRGIKESKVDESKHTQKIDTFNKVVINKKINYSKTSNEKAEEALKIIMDDSNKSSKDNYTKALKVEAKTRKKEMQYVVVKKGDTLFYIAKRIYGDAMKYPIIFEANPDILNDPARIFIGQKLRVPKLAEAI